jgi:hypothetical protein
MKRDSRGAFDFKQTANTFMLRCVLLQQFLNGWLRCKMV